MCDISTVTILYIHIVILQLKSNQYATLLKDSVWQIFHLPDKLHVLHVFVCGGSGYAASYTLERQVPTEDMYATPHKDRQGNIRRVTDNTLL